MLEKTKKIKERYDELTQLIMKPEIIADNRLWKTLVKERSRLEVVAEKHLLLSKMYDELEKAKIGVKNETDAEMRDLFYDEVGSLKKQITLLEEELKVLLLPRDENDDKNVIMEIRPAAGGDESALFGQELLSMYARFADRKHWKFEPIDIADTELGGIKEAVFLIKGGNAYSLLKFESGVHRVQRVPETESQGRVHTSTVTVAVLPEVEEVDFEIDEKDLKVDTYRSSGAGGQHVNKTESAIRITHLPTGMVVSCQDERSQIKNRERAMGVLKAKLYDFYKTQRDNELKSTRKNQVGTGDRSERIRTYNFPQGRITDHRINFTAYNLSAFMDGDIEALLDELVMADQKAKLENA